MADRAQEAKVTSNATDAQEQNKKRRVEKVRLRERRTKTGIRKTCVRGQA